MARESIDLTGDSPPPQVISDNHDDGEVVFLRSVDKRSSARPPPPHTPAVRRTASQKMSGTSQTSIREGNTSFLSSKSASGSSNRLARSTANLPLLSGNGTSPKLDSAGKRVTKAEALRNDGTKEPGDQDAKASSLATECDARFSTGLQAHPNQGQNGSSTSHSGKPSSPSLSVGSKPRQALRQSDTGPEPSSAASVNARSAASSRLALAARKANVEEGVHSRQNAASHDDLLRLLTERKKSINKARIHRSPQNEVSGEKESEQHQDSAVTKRASSVTSSVNAQGSTLSRPQVDSPGRQGREMRHRSISKSPKIAIGNDQSSDQDESTLQNRDDAMRSIHGSTSTETELIAALKPSSPYRTKLTTGDDKTPDQAVRGLLHAPSSKGRRAGQNELRDGRYSTQPTLGKRPRTDAPTASEQSKFRGSGSSPVSSRTQHLLGPRPASSASPGMVEKPLRPPVFPWKNSPRFEEAAPAEGPVIEAKPVAVPIGLLTQHVNSSKADLTGIGLENAPTGKVPAASEANGSDKGAKALKSFLSKKKVGRKTVGRRDISSAPSDTVRPTSSGASNLVQRRTPPKATSAVLHATKSYQTSTIEDNGVLDLPERPASARSEAGWKPAAQEKGHLSAQDTTQPQRFTLAQLSALHDPASQAAHDEILRKYLDEMDEDHERSVRYTLARTHQQVLQASPATPFTVKRRMFAQMKDVKAVPKAPHVAGGPSQRLTIEAFPARVSKVSTHTVAVPITPYSSTVKTVPYYVDYVNLGMSILAENEKRLLYQPYFSEDFQEDRNGQIEDLNEELDRRFYRFIEQRRAKQLETEVARKRYQYLESFWTDVGISPSHIVDYLVSIDEAKAPADADLAATYDTTDVKQALALRSKLWVDDHEPTHSKWVKYRSLRSEPTFTDLSKASLASSAFYKKTRSSIWNVVMLSPEVKRFMDESLAEDGISGADPSFRKFEGQSGTHRSVACRICHV